MNAMAEKACPRIIEVYAYLIVNQHSILKTKGVHRSCIQRPLSKQKMEFRCSDPDTSSGTNGHLLLFPHPAQGHVAPFMKLAYRLAACRVKVTVAITEFFYARMMNSMEPPFVSGMATLPEMGEQQKLVKIVPVPDGLEPDDDRKDEFKLSQSMCKVMPGYLEDLIKKINQQEGGQKITCVIADVACGWGLEVAAKLGLKGGSFFVSAPAVLAMALQFPKLIESGIINTDGTPRRNEKIELSPNLPTLSPAELFWNRPGNPSLQKGMFAFVRALCQIVKSSNWVMCNWFYELDPSANDLLPTNVLPVGPLLANGQPSGNFWSEDLTCLSWLDRQPPGSVIYAAFGSSSMFSEQQFSELALGFELVGQPFLWVVRPDFVDGDSNNNPDGFAGKVADHGKIVPWAPQEKVLAHPSVACYITHCGWNSIMEGVSNGVPLLCWPYFADQFHNKTCISEGWKNGLWLKPDENGIVSRYEIRRKVDELLSSAVIRENALKLKGLAQKSIRPGGSSSKNLEDFVKRIKG